jgi:hypothetical protein
MFGLLCLFLFLFLCGGGGGGGGGRDFFFFISFNVVLQPSTTVPCYHTRVWYSSSTTV